MFDPVTEQSTSGQSLKKGFAYLGFLASDLSREQIYISTDNSIHVTCSHPAFFFQHGFGQKYFF